MRLGPDHLPDDVPGLKIEVNKSARRRPKLVWLVVMEFRRARYQLSPRSSVLHGTGRRRASGIKACSRFLFSIRKIGRMPPVVTPFGQAGEAIIDETGELNPVTAYDESKMMSKRDISRLAGRGRLRLVYLRPATAYGLSPRLRFDIVLNNLVARAFITRKIQLKSDGAPWRPIVHNEDISRAFIAWARRPTTTASAIWPRLSQRSYWDALLSLWTMPPNKRSYCLNFEKIGRKLPAFKPQWDAHQRPPFEARCMPLYQAATLTKSSSHVSARKCRYCSARSRSAKRLKGRSTSA
jgi:NAD dependent epimerase/dehydratase family